MGQNNEEAIDENDIEYQNQKSCKMFLGLSAEEMDIVRENAQTRRKNKHHQQQMERRVSCPSPGASNNRKQLQVHRGGVVRTSSAYELSLGLEPGELSSIYSLVAEPEEEQGAV